MTNNKTLRIAVSGGDYAGKDTMLNFIKHAYEPLSFSDGLKKIAHDIFPWCNLDYLPDEKENKVIYTNPDTGKVYSPRMVWETLDCLPQIDPDVFIRPLHDLQENTLAQGQHRLCIKDIRRPRELEYCLKNDYTVVYINTDDERWLNKVATDDREIIQYRDQVIKSKADIVYFNSKSDKLWKENFASFVSELLYRLGDEKIAEDVYSKYILHTIN